MHYLGLRSTLKDMIKILDILNANLTNSIGISVEELHNLLNIDDKEYVLNLLTILDLDEYIEIFDNIIVKIRMKGIVLLEEYRKREEF